MCTKHIINNANDWKFWKWQRSVGFYIILILFIYVSVLNKLSPTWKSVLVFGKSSVCPTHSWISRKAMIPAKYFNICPVSEEMRN